MEDQHKTKTQLIAELEALRQEIAARKNGELASKLAIIVQNVSDLIFLIRVEPGPRFRCLAVNPALLKAVGFTEQEIVGRSIDDIFPPEEAAAIVKNYTRALLAREPITYEEQRNLPAGQQMFETTLTPILNEYGECTHLLGTSINITERKKAELALRESEERYRMISQSISDYAFSYHLDEDGTTWLDWITESFSKISGYAIEELLNRPSSWTRYIHPADWDRVAQAIKSLESGKPVSYECRLITKAGDIRWIESHLGAFTDEERQTCRIYGAARDITERKQAEEERLQIQRQLLRAQKLEAIGTLAGGLAHDLNNLLAVVVGFTELALDNVPQESMTHRNLEEALQASFRAKALLQQLLTFSHSSLQERESLALFPLVEETLQLLRVSFPPSIVVSSCCMDPETKIWGNPSQLQQMVMNLCMNAAHAMEEHGGAMTVSLQRIEADEALCRTVLQLQPGVYARLSVQDTGTGMTPEVVERIFEPFFTTKPIGQGSGLGLAVVHGIVTSHNGAIAVESQPGKGTTIHTYFPLITDDILPAQSSSSSSDSGKGAYPYDAHSGY